MLKMEFYVIFCLLLFLIAVGVWRKWKCYDTHVCMIAIVILGDVVVLVAIVDLGDVAFGVVAVVVWTISGLCRRSWSGTAVV